MRIAVFTECYHPIVNGVVVSVETFAGELIKLGHQVDIYAPAFPGYRDPESNVFRMPSVSPPVRVQYPLAIPGSSFLLRRTITTRRPDIIHAQHPFSTGREARRWARRLGRPLVFTYHTLIREYAHYVPLPQPLVRAMAVRVSRGFSNSADCVVVPTTATGDLLRSYGVRSRIEVIPTGIDLELARSAERAPARARFGLPAGVPVVIYSGRIAREKSLDVLVRAFAQVGQRLPDARLLLVGGGPWLEQCQALAQSLHLDSHVHFTGYLPRREVFDCLAESQVFAFASLTDTQGVVVLEAMALGCPPVAVRSGAVADIIRDGVDGLLVEPTPDGLAEGLLRVLEDDDLRRALAGQARPRAEAFSSSRMAARLSQVYQTLLPGGHPAAGPVG
jgi:glycosyltransferase involved in cell wall biosynthesis